jgi:putative chitinase
MTPEDLARCTGARIDRAQSALAGIESAMQHYDISTPARMGMFLANVGHESGGLKWLTEIWGPTQVQMRYEGRQDLGNNQPGDGTRFKGRGYLQTTGRANYAKLTQRLRARWPQSDVPDFEATPEVLAQPEWAAISAADYWDMRNLNALADRGAFLDVVKKINGGTNGLEDRMRLWSEAQKVLA